MRPFLLGCCLCATAATAQAETLSAEIGRSGIAATEVRLAALPNPSDEEKFALGGLRFLRAIEISFQIRWRNGITGETGSLPLLRVPMAANPNPAPFDPSAISEIFRQAETNLAGAHQVLESIPDGASFGLTIDLADLWMDVDSDGKRGSREGVVRLLGPTLLDRRWNEGFLTGPAPKIRFDAADAAWLAGYAHGLEAVSEVVLAYDPTEPIARVMAARARLAEHGPPPHHWLLTEPPHDLNLMDYIVIVFDTAKQQPDPARMAAARDNLFALIAQNRIFWRRVAAETDNEAEWLPNDQQTSALMSLPPGTGKVWLAVLDDGEALLKGEKLIPYWRSGPGAGINAAKLLTEPRPVDFLGWAQGWAALPYYQEGETVSRENWGRFESLSSGEPMLLALWLN